jgi:hypothetical protein
MLMKYILRSAGLALAAAAAGYLLSWGLFATHQELGMTGSTSASIAGWSFLVVLLGSLLFYGARSAAGK